MGQDARPVRADHPLQDVGAALGVDAVGGGPVTDPRVEPGRTPSDPPARFVGRDLLEDRRTSSARPVGWSGSTRVPAREPIWALAPRVQCDAEQSTWREPTCRLCRATGPSGCRIMWHGGHGRSGRPDWRPRWRQGQSDASGGCRPWVRLPHDSQRPMWTRNLRINGFRGISVWNCSAVPVSTKATPAVRAGIGELGLVALGDLFGWGRRAVPVLAVGVP